MSFKNLVADERVLSGIQRILHKPLKGLLGVRKNPQCGWGVFNISTKESIVANTVLTLYPGR